MMMNHPEGTSREKDLIKFTPDNDLFANLISNAKISTPGYFLSCFVWFCLVLCLVLSGFGLVFDRPESIFILVHSH